MSTTDGFGATTGASASVKFPAWAQHTLVFVIFITIWEMAVQFNWVSALILPSPFAVVAAWWDLAIVRGIIWPHFFTTLTEVLVGFAIGATFGVGIAILSAINMTFRRLVSPYMVALQVTPRIAIAPIIVAWLGFGMEPKMAIAAIICFFPMFINALTGLMQVDHENLEMFESMRASKWQIFRHLQLPGAMPVIMAGFKTGISLALIGAIVGEFVSASEGIGVLIQRFSFQLLLPQAFASLIMLTAMGLFLYGVATFADRHIVFWRHSDLVNKISRRMRAKNAGLAGIKPAE
ncbi:ABC transporter permease [Ponticoccus sp. SC2-23]|uniref:ABC transporter permease n=1 Tax=Alexandriicola marinus TaxID=2081710 RepID=UPI000FDC2DDF|nr:ABC transporter permease [Alexandriicola marinus]MBM1222611.1 ABC transporter permease [Ponticoccus sp. SC6-9]MBM1227115.1 ABC transporter permease [Ponticoccus sp. SC6-15]MBM1231537.1 ABC transporter permease [Ponticoccus sp. SC6-38]MBM1236027.1 ABC transporter permease [Ponticoccus sp. SC6-45]MBM1240560.1 ABC transporter permease [Ponticoccus sp. SC6-49]MBM1245095.1 ABC transporter permease [Ponticoccus sp. SC2-64]MBM1249501.1 ABC transporter permease [Ponticoccus sp. SC6-42]MBM1254053